MFKHHSFFFCFLFGSNSSPWLGTCHDCQPAIAFLLEQEVNWLGRVVPHDMAEVFTESKFDMQQSQIDCSSIIISGQSPTSNICHSLKMDCETAAPAFATQLSQ